LECKATHNQAQGLATRSATLLRKQAAEYVRQKQAISENPTPSPNFGTNRYNAVIEVWTRFASQADFAVAIEALYSMTVPDFCVKLELGVGVHWGDEISLNALRAINE